jgi:hypothetical protein
VLGDEDLALERAVVVVVVGVGPGDAEGIAVGQAERIAEIHGLLLVGRDRVAVQILGELRHTLCRGDL